MDTKTPIDASGSVSQLDFHRGQTLLQLAAKYPRLSQVMLEEVQNALDAGATEIKIRINQKTRNIVIRDNGDGVSKPMFEKALTQVAHTIKDATKLGQFGIGLISPLGKCERFTFTSCPKPDKEGYKRWSFNTTKIERQAGKIQVPLEEVDYYYSPGRTGQNSRNFVNWRTEVCIYAFSKDSVINELTIDGLVQDIRDRFSIVMRRNKVRIDVRITTPSGAVSEETVLATKFLGIKLKPYETNVLDAGRVSFNLYLRRGDNRKRGVIQMGVRNNDFRFPAGNFTRSARRLDLIDKGALDAISQGIFEGEIVVDFATLRTERNNFVLNDAFNGVLRAIQNWYLEVGIDLLQERDDRERFKRYQTLGLRSLKTVDDLLRMPEFSHLRELVRSFSKGTIGEGHTEVPGTKAKQKRRSKSTHVEKKMEGGKSHLRDKPSKEKKGHIPLTATGPVGTNRTVTVNNSSGLQFSYEEFLTEEKLFKLDTQQGILSFNVRHPHWAQCEKKDTWLLRLQEHVTVMALTRELLEDDSKPHADLFSEECMRTFVVFIVNSTGRP